MMGAEELAGEADVDGAAPVGRDDVLDAARRPRDPGVVDQRVEAAERVADLREQPGDGLVVRYVAEAGAMVGMDFLEIGEMRFGNVADMNPGAVLDEEIGDRAADAGGALQ